MEEAGEVVVVVMVAAVVPSAKVFTHSNSVYDFLKRK